MKRSHFSTDTLANSQIKGHNNTTVSDIRDGHSRGRRANWQSECSIVRLGALHDRESYLTERRIRRRPN